MGRVTSSYGHGLGVSLCFLAIFGSVQSAGADFKLPILHPVTKIISVPEDISLDLLGSFAKVRNLTVEIRMEPGQMISEQLIKYLENKFPNATKRIVASGLLRPVHVNRYRNLSHLELQYELGLSTLDSKTINSLYALGPVRKMLVLDQKFSHAALNKVRKLKFFVPVIRISTTRLTQEQLDWLSEDKHRPTAFILPPDFEPAHLSDLVAFHPLRLEVHTVKNRIDPDLLKVLMALKKAEITIVVNGNFTMQDARNLAMLDRFSIKIHLKKKNGQMIPGLFELLNQIQPP